MAYASWWNATHGKTTGATKSTDKKTTESAEKKQGSASASTSASTSASASAAVSAPSSAAASASASVGSSKVPASQERTMKPADPKAKPTPKTEPPKSTQTTKPKTTTTTTSSSTSSSTTKPSSGRGPTKQDAKKADPGKPKDSAVSSSAAGKAAAAAVGAAAVGATAVGTAAVVSSSKPKEEVKEEKKLVSVDKIAAESAPSKSEKDDALDLLIDTLGGPESVPESPKFTGPEIADTPATSEYLEALGKRETSIPPEYRHLLDGKGEKPIQPSPILPEESMADDDLIAAMSSEFVSSPAPPEEKKPKLEEKKAQKASTAPIVSSQSQSAALSDEALDELLGTLEPPPSTAPESPQFTGPEITENITSTNIEGLGKREITLPPAYRHLLDGKDKAGKPIPPPVETPEPAMSDSDVLDELSKDFVTSPLSPVQPSAPPAAVTSKNTTQDKQGKADVVVPSSASSTQAATTPSAGIDDALDELMGTLEGPEFAAPESPAYTGPQVTETVATSTHFEELGKRESSIPPAYRNLLDGKEGGKPAPPPPEEKPLTESELLDELDFTCPSSPAVQKTTDAKPKDAEIKKTEPDVVLSASSSSTVQAAPSKATTCKADPLDALSDTLGTRQQDPNDQKPLVDKVKEQSGKGKKDKLGEDEETIPPEYRLKENKDKDGKPLLPKAENPPAMSEDDLLDALGFDTSPVVSQCPALKPPERPSQKSGSEEVLSCSKVSSVHSSAPLPSSAESRAKKPSETDAHIPDDALDLLSGSLGTRQEDPDENKPIVDLVKEKAKKEHIDRLGDRDDTIPPEYRNLLDGKVQGKPAKPEEVQPKSPISDDAAIDALSSGFSSCDTGSADKAKCQDKTEKSASSTPASQTAGKTPEDTKDKTGKSSTSTPVSQTAGKTPEAPKPSSQSSSSTPSALKTSKS